jgi:hypothetical protein
MLIYGYNYNTNGLYNTQSNSFPIQVNMQQNIIRNPNYFSVHTLSNNFKNSNNPQNGGIMQTMNYIHSNLATCPSLHTQQQKSQQRNSNLGLSFTSTNI